MSAVNDLTGQKFGRLTVICRVSNTPDGRAKWKCVCDCGAEHIVIGSLLKSGQIQSCGCLSRDRHYATHRMSYTRLYRIWCGMKDRCIRPNHKSFKDYGGRGITVCSEWRDDFSTFATWAIEHGYQNDLSIDRIDNDGPYSPNNCRWVNMKEQCKNQRNTRLLEYQGQIKTLGEWAEQTGIPIKLISSRFARGWTAERIFAEPVHSKCKNHRGKNNSGGAAGPAQ